MSLGCTSPDGVGVCKENMLGSVGYPKAPLVTCAEIPPKLSKQLGGLLRLAAVDFVFREDLHCGIVCVSRWHLSLDGLQAKSLTLPLLSRKSASASSSRILLATSDAI